MIIQKSTLLALFGLITLFAIFSVVFYVTEKKKNLDNQDKSTYHFQRDYFKVVIFSELELELQTANHLATPIPDSFASSTFFSHLQNRASSIGDTLQIYLKNPALVQDFKKLDFFTYKKINDHQFQICTTFDAPLDPPLAAYYQIESWIHPQGEVCFLRDATWKPEENDAGLRG